MPGLDVRESLSNVDFDGCWEKESLKRETDSQQFGQIEFYTAIKFSVIFHQSVIDGQFFTKIDK